MTRIMLVGYDPKTEDFSDPSHPPETTAETIEAGIAFGLSQMRDQGWIVDVCLIPFQEKPQAVELRVQRQMESAIYTCVVMGGGIRLPSNHLVFEAVLNAVHRAGPTASIALNSGPEDSASSAARRLRLDGPKV